MENTVCSYDPYAHQPTATTKNTRHKNNNQSRVTNKNRYEKKKRGRTTFCIRGLASSVNGKLLTKSKKENQNNK